MLLRLPRLRLAGLVCAALLALPGPVHAQRAAEPGDRVRILAPSAADSLLAGTIVAFDSAVLLLAPPSSSGSRAVPLRAIERIEVHQRGRRKTLTGALLGGMAGAVAGYLLADALVDESGCEYVCGLPDVAGGLAGGIGGSVIGGRIGSRRRGRDRWIEAEIPRPRQER